MGDIATFIVILLLLALGILIGYRIGTELGGRAITKSEYWKYNALVLLVGMLLVALVGILGLPVLGACGFGIMGGGLLGLKMEFGESVGLWRKHDKAFNINREQQKVADEGTGEERRRRKRARREGVEEPQLISVENNDNRSAENKR